VRSGRLTAFVGREHELGLRLERWNLAQDAEGQVVLLSSEPGIGKSLRNPFATGNIRQWP
jgi:hypothetical protein